MKVVSLLALAAVLGFSLSTWAADESVKADAALERARIDRERIEATVAFDAQEQHCYSTISVNACLRDVGLRRIETMSNFKRQETKLNDAQRSQQAQEQVQRTQEKLDARRQRDAQAADAPVTSLSERQAAQREKQAQHRNQKSPAQSELPEAKATNAPNQAELELRRAAHAQKLKEAEQRRFDRDKRLREAKPAQSLPL